MLLVSTSLYYNFVLKLMRSLFKLSKSALIKTMTICKTDYDALRNSVSNCSYQEYLSNKIV